MALLRFFVSTALEVQPIGFGSCVPNPSASRVRPAWRLRPGWPCRRILLSAALARFLSRSVPPIRIGAGFPAQALLRFRVDVPTHERAPLQGFDPRMESAEIVVRSRPAPSEFPSRVFSSAALAHGFFPGPSSRALSTARAFARAVRRSRVLRSGRIGLPRMAADPLGFFDLSVTRGSSPAPNSSSQGSAAHWRASPLPPFRASRRDVGPCILRRERRQQKSTTFEGKNE